MRIAHIVPLTESVPPKSQNGLEFTVSWITEELVRRGHEVTLFASSESKTRAKLFSILPKATHDDDITWIGQPLFNIWNATLAALQSGSFDIIHSHTFESSFIQPFLTVPFIQTIHHPYSKDFLAPFLKEKRLLKTLKPVLEQYRKINYVTVSENQRAAFKSKGSLVFKKHAMIHNGIPTEKFSFNAKPQDYLLYIGYINKDKGADVAVRVARKLGMKLILAGNNFGEETFFKKHIRPYLNDKIRYVGPVNFKQKNKLYKNAIVKLAPLMWDEPFGLTLAEAQACGTPVIAFNKGAASEIIKNGKTGFIVKNEKEMCEAVKKISSINRRACRDHIEKNFSVNHMVDDYEKLYKKLLRKV